MSIADKELKDALEQTALQFLETEKWNEKQSVPFSLSDIRQFGICSINKEKYTLMIKTKNNNIYLYDVPWTAFNNVDDYFERLYAQYVLNNL